ncbi:hypothetical protein [Enterococcus sp. AZ177]|uniref:hypothetical protein n=1 Tax=unclassified Enterococcus TaxID=2608891 RepID=UPI003D2FF0BB
MLFHDKQAMLFCMHCQQETLHDIQYMNDIISSIECTECHNQMSIDIDAMNQFYHYLYERLISKPGRLTEEARLDFNKFLATMPMRIISKPMRFTSEYNQMNKEVKDYVSRVKQDEDQDD